MSNPFQQARALEALVSQERAGALGLTGQRLEREVTRLRELKREPPSARTARMLADAEDEVARQLWNLIVQREALGLSRHDEVYETYGIPKSVVPRPF